MHNFTTPSWILVTVVSGKKKNTKNSGLPKLLNYLRTDNSAMQLIAQFPQHPMIHRSLGFAQSWYCVFIEQIVTTKCSQMKFSVSNKNKSTLLFRNKVCIGLRFCFVLFKVSMLPHIETTCEAFCQKMCRNTKRLETSRGKAVPSSG